MRYGFFGTEQRGTRAIVQGFDSIGWERVHGPGWDVLWTLSMRQLDQYLKFLTPGQRVNHMPGWWHYAGKRTGPVVHGYRRKHDLLDDPAWDFCPLTYLLPFQIENFRQARQQHPDWIWLAKPHKSATKGKGLWLLDEGEEPPEESEYFVQRYINNPHLIDGCKYNIRVVCLVPCADPLLVYIHRELNLTISTTTYSGEEDRRGDLAAHIVNPGLQGDLAGSRDAVRRITTNEWFDILRQDGTNGDDVWSRIGHVIGSLFEAAHLPMAESVRRNIPYRLNCFELLGFDLLLDEAFNPWIVECNMNPTQSERAPVVERFRNILSLLGIHADRPPVDSPGFGGTTVHQAIHDPSGLELLRTGGFDWIEHEREHIGLFDRVVPRSG